MTVGELLDKVTSQELTEWAAYFGLVAEERDKAMRDAEFNRRAASAARGTFKRGAGR